MDRSRLLVPFAFVLVLSWMATSHAQEGEKRRGGGFLGGFSRTIDKPALLASAQVREELKVTPEQAKKVDEIVAAYRQESSEVFSGARGRDLSTEEREKKRKEGMEKTVELRKKTETKLAAALEKSQMQRLSEIELQQQGVDALVSEQVIASLKLKPEQVEGIRSALSTREEEMRKVGGGRRGRAGRGEGDGAKEGSKEGAKEGPKDVREEVEKVRKQTEEKAFAALSKEQREEFDKMKGKPFELDRRSLRGDRPGGGQGKARGNREGGEKKRPPEDEV